MTRIRFAGRIAVALLAGLAPAGSALAEPQLFQGRVVVMGEPWTLSNPGRIASVQGSAPASFGIDASLLGGSLTLTGTVAGQPATRFFSFVNEAGGLAGGAGPGTAALTPLPSVPGFRASSSSGAQRFGGTLRLLGHAALKWADATPLHQTIVDLPLTPIGGSIGESRTNLHGGTGGFTRTTLWGLPWTTGAVTAMGTTPMGAFTTATAQGSDQRTPAGVGTIQLVAPFLVKRSFDLAPGYELRGGSVATLTLQFAPEPAANLLLLCGVAGLALLSRFARRG
jgi:hypothetical protein